jgi:hypothetical protein
MYSFARVPIQYSGVQVAARKVNTDLKNKKNLKMHLFDSEGCRSDEWYATLLHPISRAHRVLTRTRRHKLNTSKLQYVKKLGGVTVPVPG